MSPLLFILSLIPLTKLLNREKLGYTFSNWHTTINHLLFMDDLKLYGRNEEQISKLLEIVSLFTKDVGMEFGLDKFAVLNVNGSGKISSRGVELPDGNIIREVDADGCKYLGILRERDIKGREMK
ncbi:MAG: reverse transcriptase domain-containing protein, partial [Bacteroidota bacterium]